MFTIRLGPVIRSLALSTFAAGFSQAASITVSPTVTTNGALFHYSYTISNSSGLDVPVIDITVARGTGIISNLIAPAGFLTAYDSTLGLVSFLENTGVFGSAAIGGFAFDSPLPSRATNYTATFFDGSVEVGSTAGPAVPEPSSLLLFSFGSAILAYFRKSISKFTQRTQS